MNNKKGNVSFKFLKQYTTGYTYFGAPFGTSVGKKIARNSLNQ